ncbi:MAG: ribosomal protein [Rickettsiales bacterium]|jgi:small subunit ribosomal protein S6|nr:ribosomal protein [Rickettsiales bacterium]
MALYESTFIARQDISTKDVENVIDKLTDVLKTNGGKVVKVERWGLRNLAYEINKNRKGHYVMLSIDASPKAMKEFAHTVRYTQDILRILTLSVDAHSKEASPILRADRDGPSTGREGGFGGRDREGGGFRGDREGGFRGGDREPRGDREGAPRRNNDQDAA